MRHDVHGELTCTSGKGLPIADTIIGSVLLVGAAQGSVYYTTEGGKRSGPAPGAALGAAFLVSAIYGYIVTGDCRDAKKYWAEHKTEELERAGEQASSETPPDANAR